MTMLAITVIICASAVLSVFAISDCIKSVTVIKHMPVEFIEEMWKS